MDRYVTTFKTVGAAYDETIVLLKELNQKNWNEVARLTHEENLLKKRSSKWIKMLLRNVRKRYFEHHSPLPEVQNLSRFLLNFDSNQVRIQALFQYICKSDPLVDRFVIDLVGSNLNKYGSFRLTKTIFWEFFSKEAEIHTELQVWADYTKEKWGSDFFAFLRSSGLMENHPGVRVEKFVIKPETFAFFLYGLIQTWEF